MKRFENRVAIVTGASSGIGQATARRLAREGATVVAMARRADRLADLAAEFPSIRPAACNVVDHEALAAHVEQTVADLGKIDILVNNAGFSYYERLDECSLESWRETLAVNLESMFVLTKLVASHMRRQKYGRVVNISSTQSIAAEGSVGAYAASKGAINAWSRALAVDLAPDGILVNIVAPGCTHTEMSIIDGVDETQTEMFQEWYVRQRKIPLARPGTSDEVASAIAFLSSEECSYITGHTLVVDGGLTITF